MRFHDPRLSPAAAILAIAGALALPVAIAAWIFLGPEVEETPNGFRVEPDVFEAELERYDWAEIRPGDWVEHDVATTSDVVENFRVRTRLSCVGLEGGTAWVEARDHLVARFFPGSSVLCEVERGSGRIARAWWGGPGRATKPVEVRRVTSGSGVPGFERRARTDGATLAVSGVDLPCMRAVLQDRPAGGAWSTRSTVWLSREVPFPRSANTSSAEDQMVWVGAPARGGVAREEFRGLTVRMTTVLAAWGRDAKRTVWPESARAR